MVEIIKKLCQKKQISFLELEKKLNLTTSSIRRWDTSTPSADKLYKVAQFFDVPMEYLLTGKVKDYTLEERELIKLYRAADDRGKERIMQDAQIEGSAGKSLDSQIS